MSFGRACFPTVLSLSLISAASSAFAQSPSNQILVPANLQLQHQTDTSHLDKWIKLEAGLYNLVISFDAEAKHFERALTAYEPIFLKTQKQQLLHPEQKISYSPEEQAYHAVAVLEPTLCQKLDIALQKYIRENIDALSVSVNALAKDAANYSDEQKSEIANTVRTAFSALVPRERRAQEILYACIFRRNAPNGTPRKYSVEKTMRAWFAADAVLLDAWLGPVD